MKTWYWAECEKCMEIQTFFVNNPNVTSSYLGDEEDNKRIGAWFQKHYGCELKMGWRDDHMDALWEKGYSNGDLRKGQGK